jgi:transaldolase
MKLFVDSADVAELKALAATGLVDGVTTNPSLIAKQGGVFLDTIAQICALVEGPVSAEVASTDYDTMVKEGERLAAIAANVVVKLPLTWDGLKAAKHFSHQGVKTNVTLCFSPVQALMAAKAGATYISPFVGRLDDHGAEGMDLISDIRAVYDQYAFDTEILAASVRSNGHVRDAALAGADCATLPPAVFKGLLSHPLTERGLQQFTADWAASGQTILG